jgi:hypothetical protein
MSVKQAKIARQEFLKRHDKIINSALGHFRFWYKSLPWWKRAKLAWKIMRRTY